MLTIPPDLKQEIERQLSQLPEIGTGRVGLTITFHCYKGGIGSMQIHVRTDREQRPALT